MLPRWHVAGWLFAAQLMAQGASAAQANSAAVVAPTLAAAGSPDKKSLYLTAKADEAKQPHRKHARARDARRSRAPAVRLVNLHNLWTKEWLVVEVPLRGDISPPSPARVRAFLRCHFTDEEIEALDQRPLRLALEAARHFKASRIDIISGYRSPKYNLMLRKKGREVARDSQHTKGNAVDIRLPDVSPRALSKWIRGKRLGGVGIYRTSGFVHVDSGPIRSWSGR